jgi:hypothetical protein
MSSTRRYAPPRDASFIHGSTSVDARPSALVVALKLKKLYRATGSTTPERRSQRVPRVAFCSCGPRRLLPGAPLPRAGRRPCGASRRCARSARQLLRRRALSACFHGRRARACGLAPPQRVAPPLPRRRRGQPPAECGARAPPSPVRARRAAWRPARRARQHTATRLGVAAAARPQQLTWAAQKTWCVHPRPQAACRARAGPRFHCVAPALPPCPR